MFDFKIISLPPKNSRDKSRDTICVMDGEGFDTTVAFSAKCISIITTYKDGSFNGLEIYGAVDGLKNHRINMVNGRRA
jgi:hypothetical protein